MKTIVEWNENREKEGTAQTIENTLALILKGEYNIRHERNSE